MGELFVEVGVEEMPARFVQPVVEGLATNLQKLLGVLAPEAPRLFATPRRLAVAFANVSPQTPRVEKLVTGPPVAAAFRGGVATPAAAGFAAKFGLLPEQLDRVSTPKGEVIAARTTEGGARTAELVAAGLETAILAIPFKKTMRWGTRKEQFPRPIRYVCALLDGQRVPTTVCGEDTVSTSEGQWQWSPEPFPVTTAEAWLAELREKHVYADAAERRALLVDRLQRTALGLGVELRLDEDLVDEVNNLLEEPTIVVGQFDESLLELPPRLLVESMKVHQRYFPTWQGGRLTHRFLIASNNPFGDAELIATGNARVLAARFYDARFFYAEDRKKTLAEHSARLSGMMWMRGQGTMADRQIAVATAAERLAPIFGADPVVTLEAGLLCKADLATQMVGEFPELQGHVGRLLADIEGIPASIAIEEHYHPRFAGDALPTTPEGRALAMAERLTLLDTAFAAGLQPKGGADPLGLRRAANGVVAIVVDAGIGLGVGQLLKAAHRPGSSELVDFVTARLRASLVEEGIPTDVVEAVLAAGLADLTDAAARARAFGKLVQGGQFGAVRATFRRVAGLVKQNPARSVPPLGDLDRAHLGPAGSALADALGEIAPDAPVSAQLEALLALRPLVDAYFDGVMVMCDDEASRKSRLGLLRVIVERFGTLADFSKLSTD